MGISCFKKTAYETYSKYLFDDISSLKEEWSSINLFKLKKKFKMNCFTDQNHSQKYLTFEAFKLIFSQFCKEKQNFYGERHQRRLFDLFNSNSHDLLSWDNFYIGLTLCYFCSEEKLAVLMFALFDQQLSLQLAKLQLEQLLLINCNYFRKQTNSIDQQTFLEELLSNKKSLSLSNWIQESEIHIQFNEFRKLFNVFVEEDLEKDMALNFKEMNELYNDQQKRYIGYLINCKWFQSWKTYIYKQYNIEINGFSQNITYIKSIRTLKSLKTKRSIRNIKSFNSIKSSKTILSSKSKKMIETPKLKKISLQKNISQISSTNQYNLISNNIGDKPFQIYNNILQGEFMEILRPELIQNVHYVIVSAQIWRRLKFIYGAYPQFRRTGKKNIQIYPKNLRIYSKFSNGKIDYNQEKICQFSNYMSIGQLISKVNEIEMADLEKFKLFYKTCSMTKWLLIQNLDDKVYQFSSEQIIFLSIVPNYQLQSFVNQNCKTAQSIDKINIGDEFLYTEQGRNTKRAVFLGKNKDKMIIHIKNSPYIYDICLDKSQFEKCATLIKNNNQNLKIKLRSQQFTLLGIAYQKGFGFASSLLLILFSNKNLGDLLLNLYNKYKQPTNLIQQLSYIFFMISNKLRISSIVVSDLIRKYFFDYVNFQITMCQEFLDQIMVTIFAELQALSSQYQNPLAQYILQLQSIVQCYLCNSSSSRPTRLYSLSLPIVPQKAKYYEVIYIPFAFNFKDRGYRRYGFRLGEKATFREYKQAFEKVSQVGSNTYALAEVHCNNIIKNYLNAMNDVTLEQILLKEDDKVYAFELCFDMSSFVSDHYTGGVLRNRDLQIDQLIDFQIKSIQRKESKSKQNRTEFSKKHQKKFDMSNVWTFAMIKQITIEPYTRKTYITVEHRQNRTQKITTVLNVEQTQIAAFPSKSYQFADHYHLKMLNRIYNQVTHEMQLCNIPLIIMVTNWMRLKQLQIIVYQQIKNFIAEEYIFKVQQHQNRYSEGQLKISKKQKIKKFKQYLYEQKKPYSLVFTDFQGRCSICCKIQKSKALQNQQEFICQGCPLAPQIPIFWQIRPYQTRLCIDWKEFDSFVKPLITDHQSYFQTKSSRKNDVCQIDECISYRQRMIQENEQCLCDDFNQKKIQYKEIVHSCPQQLIIVLDRLASEGKYKHVNKKYIYFQMDNMVFKGQSYQLTAAISIEGTQLDHLFITYVKENGNWLQYCGQTVKIVKKTTVQKIIAICLHYKKISTIQSDKI